VTGKIDDADFESNVAYQTMAGGLTVTGAVCAVIAVGTIEVPPVAAAFAACSIASGAGVMMAYEWDDQTRASIVNSSQQDRSTIASWQGVGGKVGQAPLAR